MFLGSTFPALERVVLYGDWSVTIKDLHFRPLLQGLLERGCALEFGTALQWIGWTDEIRLLGECISQNGALAYPSGVIML
jgi:hypothetical protein